MALSERLLRSVAFLVPALLLAAGINALVAQYILAERYIYFWDNSGYWLMFQDFAEAFRKDFGTTLAEIGTSIATSDYNPLPILPLMPFEWAFGSGRLPYVLAIGNVAALPSALVLALVVERANSQRSSARLMVCFAAVIGLHVLWVPVLRGLPDVIGVAVAASILLVYFGGHRGTVSWKRLGVVGLLLGVLILTRRYYAFWAIGFFPAAVIADALATPRKALDWSKFARMAGGLALALAVCAALLMIFAAPLMIRITSTDYFAAFAAYQPETGTGTIGQIVDHFGIALLTLCIGGLVWLGMRAETRRLGLFLIAQAVFSITLFARTQSLFAPQHFYLLLPAAATGAAAAVAALWNAGLGAWWRASGIAVVLAVVTLSSATVFAASKLAPSPVLPRVRFAPEVRNDLDELDRLMSTLATSTLEGEHIYVAASSRTLNSSMLTTGCRTTAPELCSRIHSTADVDMRDGFPKGVLEADYVVVATPTQYHLRPEDQLVIGLLADEIRQGRGIGTSFSRQPDEFKLTGGVTAAIYEKVAPLQDSAVKALSTRLQRRYPQAASLFLPPNPDLAQ